MEKVRACEKINVQLGEVFLSQDKEERTSGTQESSNEVLRQKYKQNCTFIDKQALTRHTAAELAFLGDAVFELMVREMLLRENVPYHDMFNRAKKYVSAKAQSEMYHKIFPVLTENEQSQLKRGRNLHSASRAKNADVAEYRHATGLESLFGYLHQNGEFSRLNEIFLMCVGDMVLSK